MADQLTSGKLFRCIAQMKVEASTEEKQAQNCHCRYSHSFFFIALARAENAVLAAKVKELSFKVTELTMSNASLQAEVEMYRKEAALPNFSGLALGKTTTDSTVDVDDTPDDVFLRSGNGVCRVTYSCAPLLHCDSSHLAYFRCEIITGLPF